MEKNRVAACHLHITRYSWWCPGCTTYHLPPALQLVIGCACRSPPTQLSSSSAGDGLCMQDTNALVFRGLVAALGVSGRCDYDVNSLAVPRKAQEVGVTCRPRFQSLSLVRGPLGCRGPQGAEALCAALSVQGVQLHRGCQSQVSCCAPATAGCCPCCEQASKACG